MANGYPDIRSVIEPPTRNGPVLGYLYRRSLTESHRFVPTRSGLSHALAGAGAADAARPNASTWAIQTSISMKLFETTPRFVESPRVLAVTAVTPLPNDELLLRIGDTRHQGTPPQFYRTVSREWLTTTLCRAIGTRNSVHEFVAACVEAYDEYVRATARDMVPSPH